MQTQITARHFDANEQLRTHIDQSLSKLERYYDGIGDVHVVLCEDGAPGAKAAEVKMIVFRQTLSARHSASTYEEAVDRCTSRLKRQLMRYKSKLRSTEKDYQK